MEEMITIRELVAAVVWRWKRVLAMAICFAVLLGAVQGVRLRAENNRKTGLQESEYEQALEEYERDLAFLTAQKEQAEKALGQARTYVEQSILMQLDPADVCVGSMAFAVQSEDGQALRKLTDDTVEHTMDVICRSYAAAWDCADLTETVADTEYRGMQENLVRELVTVRADDGLLNVTVRERDDKACAQLSGMVERWLMEENDDVAAMSCPHRLTMLESSMAHIGDQTLTTAQSDALTAVTNLKSKLETAEKQIKELKAPVQATVSSGAFVKSLVKYAVVGGILGLALGCLLVLWGNIAGKRVENSLQVERVLSLPFLGSVAQAEKGMRRLSQKIAGERLWDRQETAVDYAAERICTALNGGKSVLLATGAHGTVEGPGVQALVERLEKSGVAARLVQDFNREPDAVKTLQDCDGVVVLNQAHHSGLQEAAEIISYARQTGKSVLGFAMV